MMITIAGFKKKKFKDVRKVVPYSEFEQKLLIRLEREDEEMEKLIIPNHQANPYFGH